MRFKEFGALFFRSAIGILVIALSIATGVVAYIVGAPLAFAIAIGVAGLLTIGFGTIASGIASKAAVRERDRRDAERAGEGLSAMAQDRAKLAAMRLKDAEIASKASAVALRAGEFLEACKREGGWDPRAKEALAEAIEIVDLYLKEIDDASTERRFGQPDQDPFADAKGRALAALDERARAIKDARTGIDGGLTGNERMEIKEELK